MRSNRKILGLVFGLGAVLALAPAHAGGKPFTTERSALDESASWGIDRDTGKVAIDASLLYVVDPSKRTLVINPNLAEEAAKELGATVEREGSWRLVDGSTYTPILGQLAIVVGDEPDGLVAAAGLPTVSVDRVNLVEALGGGAKRTRNWRKCTGCRGCLQGCATNVFFAGDTNFKVCEFSWPWNKCTEEMKEVCRETIFSCVNCSGPILAVNTISAWVCADNC